MMSAALVAILSVPESALADSENMIGEKHLLCAAALTVWGGLISGHLKFGPHSNLIHHAPNSSSRQT